MSWRSFKKITDSVRCGRLVTAEDQARFWQTKSTHTNLEQALSLSFLLMFCATSPGAQSSYTPSSLATFHPGMDTLIKMLQIGACAVGSEKASNVLRETYLVDFKVKFPLCEWSKMILPGRRENRKTLEPRLQSNWRCKWRKPSFRLQLEGHSYYRHNQNGWLWRVTASGSCHRSLELCQVMRSWWGLLMIMAHWSGKRSYVTIDHFQV